MILDILSNNKGEMVPLFVMTLHPKIDFSYMTLYALLYKELGCFPYKKRGVWCVEANDAEINRLQKYINTFKNNINNKQ